MVAAEDLGYWTSRVDANGNIGRDDLALMAGSYSDEQIARIRESDEKMRSATFYLTVPPWRQALRFYGMLSEQQAALQAGFEQGDALADVGIGDAQLPGGGGEAGVADDGAKELEGVEQRLIIHDVWRVVSRIG